MPTPNPQTKIKEAENGKQKQTKKRSAANKKYRKIVRLEAERFCTPPVTSGPQYRTISSSGKLTEKRRKEKNEMKIGIMKMPRVYRHL